ncbi:MAG: hypothetical protein DHS20C05_07280 [Hyphococcus sp.]|nr:MAG: hypothetical protein DHS20C05_07280 [Marinicaulis sp.]
MLIQQALFAVFAAAQAQAVSVGSDVDPDDCTFEGFPLFGDVQVVESFPDLKVQVVESFADLHVKEVTSFPDECGKWKFVESFPDLKIQYVESFPDLKIKFVESFPGLP